MGGAFVREGAFIRINTVMVNASAVDEITLKLLMMVKVKLTCN